MTCTHAHAPHSTHTRAQYERIHLAKKELHKLLEDRHLHGLPVMIVLNKIDLEPHMSKEDVCIYYHLYVTTKSTRTFAHTHTHTHTHTQVIKEMQLEHIRENAWVVTQIRYAHHSSLEKTIHTHTHTSPHTIPLQCDAAAQH